MSVKTYSVNSGPRLSISKVSSMSSAPSSPVGAEATITISAKRKNKMSADSVESYESSDPLESDYSEGDGENATNDTSSDEDDYESSQKKNSESDDESEGNGDDTDEESSVGVKDRRQYSLDDFQILKTVGKSLAF